MAITIIYNIILHDDDGVKLETLERRSRSVIDSFFLIIL